METCVGAATSYGHGLEIAEGIILHRLPFHCTGKAGAVYSAPLRICQVVFLLLRQRRGAAGLGELQFAFG
jgi:hypothetical protein